MDTETVKSLILESLIDLKILDIIGSTVEMDSIILSSDYKEKLASIDRVATEIQV